ncbi:MAG: hypothetical protein HY016_05560 [Nitrosomonadales bacterium]|nr:hypothetical protein [Nitrosomonadales bacterium]
MPNDDVEKVSSSAHRAKNQMEYQVEVPQLARSRPSSLVIAYPKAALGALHSSCVGTQCPHSSQKILGNLLPTIKRFSLFLP